MGAAPEYDEPFGIFRFLEPDLSVPAHERAFFAGPASIAAKEEKIQLHDFRTSDEVAKGSEGLDVQGFTYVTHKSSLSGDEWFEGSNAEDIYVKEVLDLALKVTGGKRAVCHQVGFRRKLSEKNVELFSYEKRGGDTDQAMKHAPLDKLFVQGRDSNPGEPNRHAHCDMILESLRDTIRLCRQDIAEAAKLSLEAEDRRSAGEEVQVPRFAAYSIWRPLTTVKRDPIAVLDYRSIEKSELAVTDFRVPGALAENREYDVKAWLHRPPRNPSKLKWYWMPEQTPEDVLFIKFSDSASDEDPRVAAGCIHCSPQIPGTEHEEVRCSVESRVYVFWD